MTPRSILIFGKGQLGTWYSEAFAKKGATITIADGDIRDTAAVRNAVLSAKPDLVLNTAGKTNIDWCEQHREETMAINILGTDNIAAASQEAGAFLLHISSGCVQESTNAEHMHTEEGAPDPICFYSWTKVWAENLVLDRSKRKGLRTLVLRPRQLLSAQPSPRNALVKMLTYNKFIDTPNSCTVIEDLMEATWQLLEKDATGLVNVVNPGVTTPYKIALVLKKRVKPDLQVNIISKEELNAMTLAKRIDAVLSTSRMESFGVTLRHIDERLNEIADQLAINLKDSANNEVMNKTAQETKDKLALVH